MNLVLDFFDVVHQNVLEISVVCLLLLGFSLISPIISRKKKLIEIKTHDVIHIDSSDESVNDD